MQNSIIGLILLIFVLILYLLLIIKRDYNKLIKSLNKSLKTLIQNSIRIFAIFLIIGMLENYLSKEAVSKFLLKFTGFVGIIIGEAVGSVMMGPAASGYPIAKYLFDNGGTVSLTTAFLLSWVMIGFISMPLEFRELGKKFMITRNIITIIGIIIVSLIMEIII